MDALPKATQEGKNRMGCLMNGKAWKPYRDPVQQGGSRPPFVVYWQRRDQGRVALTMLFIRNSQPKLIASSVYFYVPDIKGPGVITLDQPANPMLANFNPAYANYISDGNGLDKHYLTGPTDTGQLTITRFDTVARIVAGTFFFTGRTNDGSTVQVSDGRFDVQMERR